ncbi:MAG: hypothetical protein AVDCRST_MAG79-1536, partial [uncultured Thermoleophilia bacterium]
AGRDDAGARHRAARTPRAGGEEGRFGRRGRRHPRPRGGRGRGRPRRRRPRGPRHGGEGHVHGHAGGPLVAGRAVSGGLRPVPGRSRVRRRVRALRAGQPRAAHALHRLADDARGRRADPERPLGSRLRPRHRRPPRRAARARAQAARPLPGTRRAPRRVPAPPGAGLRQGAGRRARVRERRAGRQLPHRLVRAARGPAPHARPGARGLRM